MWALPARTASRHNTDATPVSLTPSINGTLYLKSSIGASQIRDGLSNTMIVGEFSGLTAGEQFSSNGSLGDNDASWGLGTGGVDGGLTSTGYAVRAVAYPPNTQFYVKNTWSCQSCPEPLENLIGRGEQHPLKSSHPGGVQAVMADGSVTFIGNGIDINVYKDLADREDGHPPVQF